MIIIEEPLVGEREGIARARKDVRSSEECVSMFYKSGSHFPLNT